MDLVAFLRRHDLGLDDMAARASEALGLAPGDVLFACGSLVEGLGNERSDVDLYLVTSRRDIRFTSLTDVTFHVGPCVVDVRVIQPAHLDALLQRFDEWSRQPRQPRLSSCLTEEDRRLLHRLSSGWPVYGQEGFRRFQARLDPRELARHKLDWASYYVTSMQIDLAGLRAEGDLIGMLFMAQELLGHVIDGLLAGHGYTNPAWKWRTRLLDQLPARPWEHELPGRPSGLSPLERYLALHAWPARISGPEVLAYALRIVSFSRVVLPWAEWRLLAPGSPAIPAVEPGDQPGARPLPHLDLDVAIRYRDGRFELFRPNVREPPYQLSPNAYSVLCLFDGETAWELAERHAARLGGGDARLLDELRGLVRYARLEPREVVDEQALAALLERPGGAPEINR